MANLNERDFSFEDVDESVVAYRAGESACTVFYFIIQKRFDACINSVCGGSFKSFEEAVEWLNANIKED